MSFAQWKSNRKASGGAPQAAVARSFLEDCPHLPVVYGALPQDIIISSWYGDHEQQILSDLYGHGAVLFRGFRVLGQNDFEQFVRVAIPETAAYVEGATPRTKLTKGIYTSTEFPADQEIAPHNELSYVVHPPARIAFCCLIAPRQGGQTPLVDVGRVYARVDPALIREFEARGGWLLRRNYDGDFGPTLQKSFGTDSLDEIKAYCERANIRLEIGAGGRLATEQVRAVVHRHPRTGEPVWFNHVAFWHPSTLPASVRASLNEIFSVREFPYSTYFGDGAPIPDTHIAALQQAYRDEEVKFAWRPGDVLLLDNWRVAHGRKPFAGERKVIVAMG
jgi:hypothetical protein